jgi:hypothetical protein
MGVWIRVGKYSEKEREKLGLEATNLKRHKCLGFKV